MLIPLGILVNYVEKIRGQLPEKFILTYLIIIVIGVYMIPVSGMTFLMLPHAIYMLFQKNQLKSRS
ncbi:DUF6463 family protein [Aquimarina sp. AD10]|uniref:DUF6463 family protein n=1 Tax=Aquimarina sp. AD10 TaxID=1714849 RepID=UPI00351981FE